MEARRGPLKRRTISMHRKDYRLFISGFHPEASKEKRDEARNRFVELYEKLQITEKEEVNWPPRMRRQVEFRSPAR